MIALSVPAEQIARSGQLITLSVNIRSGRNDKSPYFGPINVTLESPAGSILTSYNSIVSEHSSEIKLHFTIKKSGSTNAILTASNDLFKDTTNLKLIIVGKFTPYTVKH